MKNKYIFKRNILLVFILTCIMAVAEEVFFCYYMLNFADEDKKFVFVIVMCLIVTAVAAIAWISFKQVLIVNDETVTLCNTFKREQTINWKDVAITYGFKQINNATLPTVTITDGTNTIDFTGVSGKSLQMMKELCKNAHDKYNPDNLTF